MGLVGSKVNIEDEKTGEVLEIQFTDTPLNRWTGGLQDACEAFGLSRDEAMIIFYFAQCFDAKIGGISKRQPPYFRVGINQLIARGWMWRTKHALTLAQNRETEEIFKAANAAVRFGESKGTA